MGLVGDLVTAKTGTGIAGTTIDVALSLGGLSPVVWWVWMVGRTDVLDAVGARDVAFSYGYGTSTSSRRAICAQVDNAAATSNTDRAYRDDAQLIAISTASVISGLLDVNSVGANTMQFIVDQQFAADYTFIVAALAGTDISSASIVDFAMTSSGVPIDQDVTSVGYVPKYIEFLSVGLTTAFQVITTVADVIMGRAMTSPSIANHVLAAISLNAGATMDSASYANDIECLAVNLNTSSIITRAAVTATVSGGFRISHTESGSSATRVSALCLAGNFQVNMGNFLSQTDTSTRVTQTMAFLPVLTHLWSACKAESATDTPDATAEMSVGSFLGLGNGSDRCVGWIDPDNVPDSTTASAIRFNDSYVNISTLAAIEGAGQAIPGEVPPTTGFPFVMTTADPSQAFIMYASFGAGETTTAPPKMLNTGRTGGGTHFKKWN